jgi:Na+/proline symporter
VLTKRANERGTMVGMFFGFVTNFCIWQFTKIPFTWYVPLGVAMTFTVGYVASIAFGDTPKELQRG